MLAFGWVGKTRRTGVRYHGEVGAAGKVPRLALPHIDKGTNNPNIALFIGVVRLHGPELAGMEGRH